MKIFTAFSSLGIVLCGMMQAQQMPPEISSWVINTDARKGYSGISANVQKVQYSDSNVYVSCTCIPGYDIGPWKGNPNTPRNQNFVFKFTRSPRKNNGNPTRVGLGHTGVWSNGVSIFNVEDAMSYNNQGIWLRNAYFFEGPGFDNCLGHPQQNGEYHHHVSPTCLYDEKDSTHHSPIIGYAFDGFPVYGAYGWSGTDGTGTIIRMKSSWKIRTISERTILPDGSAAASAGPAISAQYPLGAFIQDFEYVAGSGTLDERNGRFCSTPEYPKGTYAYFVTLDDNLKPAFPYTMYGTYYGVVQAGNTGPGSGHQAINEAVMTYESSTSVREEHKSVQWQLWPQPAGAVVHIYIEPNSAQNISAELYNAAGAQLQQYQYMQPTGTYTLSLAEYPAGIYYLYLRSGSQIMVQKIVHNE